MARYAKAITAALMAAGGALLTALVDDTVTASEWVSIALAALGTLGAVWAVPNRSMSDS